MAVATTDLRFLWLEVTGRCQLRCRHCYSDSGPGRDHGSMTAADWRRVLDEAAELGVHEVQFIGGEPTLYPEMPELVCHALRLGLAVEVYSNLARVTDSMWETFDQPGVSLATSYYSQDAAQHDAITGRRSHDRTLANIRVGLVDVDDGQDVTAAVAELRELGVEHVKVDRVRGVGRGVRDRPTGVDQLCGHCADGSLTVSPTGDVWPCPLSRWMVVGNMRHSSLAERGRRAC